MPIEWDFNLNEKLRGILLNLVDGNALNLKEIAHALNLPLKVQKDREILRQRMRALAKSDKNLEFLAYFKGKYRILEYSEDMECMYLRYYNTSKSYIDKANKWNDNSKKVNKRNKQYVEQISIESLL